MAIGGTIGGILGAAIGSGIPVVGTTIGASIGTGLGQLVEGGIQKKKAKSMLPSPEDVGERALLNALRRRQQAVATGAAYSPEITGLKQTGKTMLKNAFAAGGPVNQGMYSNFMNQAMNNITQQRSQELAQLFGQQAQSVKDISNRKADTTLLPRNEMLADVAQNEKAGFQNLATALMPKGDFRYNELGETPEEEAKRKKEERLKKKQEEEQLKANQGTTGGTSDNTTGGSN